MSTFPCTDCMTFSVVSGARKATVSLSLSRASSGASACPSLGCPSSATAPWVCSPEPSSLAASPSTASWAAPPGASALLESSPEGFTASDWSMSAAELVTKSLRDQSWKVESDNWQSKLLPSTSLTSSRHGRLPCTSPKRFCWIRTLLPASSSEANWELTCHHPGGPCVCISASVTTRASRPLPAEVRKIAGWSELSVPARSRISESDFACSGGRGALTCFAFFFRSTAYHL
mmetsp:Transcript_65986/g.204244  ORF Transcript_65986/g.204244 Transcript_65986/m.204244 type:complete len:232 (+) Transcript_65986:243-938(+)